MATAMVQAKTDEENGSVFGVETRKGEIYPGVCNMEAPGTKTWFGAEGISCMVKTLTRRENIEGFVRNSLNSTL